MSNYCSGIYILAICMIVRMQSCARIIIVWDVDDNSNCNGLHLIVHSDNNDVRLWNCSIDHINFLPQWFVLTHLHGRWMEEFMLFTPFNDQKMEYCGEKNNVTAKMNTLQCSTYNSNCMDESLLWFWLEFISMQVLASYEETVYKFLQWFKFLGYCHIACCYQYNCMINWIVPCVQLCDCAIATLSSYIFVRISLQPIEEDPK